MALHEITLPDGSKARLGNLFPAKAVGPHTVYGDTPDTPMVARSRWGTLLQAYSPGPADPFLPPVHHQRDVGQCNAEAATECVEYLRARQGLPHCRLSGADLYDRINGGRDEGSLLEDALRELETTGVGLASTSGEIWKDGVWKGPAPAAERKRFRVTERYLCPTFDHVMSAILSGFPVEIGILWYDNYKPDADGWLPSPAGNAGGHAVMSFKPAARNGAFGVWTRQSWGKDWFPQFDNCFAVPETHFAGPVGGWWALRSVVDEGGVIPPAA